MNPGPPCECGRAKDARAKRCVNCYHAPWSEVDDASLRQMIELGLTHRVIGQRLCRTAAAVTSRSRQMGWRLSPEAAARNKQEGRRAFWGDPRRAEAWKAKHRREQLSPETLEIHRQRALARHAVGDFVFRCVGHAEETRKKMSASHKRRADCRLSFAPRGHPLRAEYKQLVRLLGKQDARRLIEEEIARLSTFERQLLRVQGGAALTRKISVPSKSYAHALGQASS